MTTLRVVYVHGAGPQENRDLLKRRLDGHLFGSNQLTRTAIAYYAHILHVEPPPPPFLQGTDAAEATEIEALFQERAAEIEAAQPPAVLEGVAFPDPAFRLLARIASADVVEYLFGGRANQIRAAVRQVVDAAPGPLVIVAHSLGTIVAVDVLSELGGRDVPLFVTLGSPLGIDNVRRRLAGGGGPPVAIPTGVARWENFADPHDPVALEQTLTDEFEKQGLIVDHAVNNRALLNHDLTGYLDTDPVGELIREVAG